MKKFFTLIAMMFVAGATFAQDDVEWGPNEFANSDLEADAEYPWFHVKSNVDNPDAAITTAVPVAGAGVDGSKGIKVLAGAGAAQDWDAQFWIQIPTEIAEAVQEYGDQVLISFDCRAEWTTIAEEEVDEISIGTQGHNEPGSYRNNTGCGTVTFTKEWSHHEGTLAPDANPYSIAFNLCAGHHDDDVTFYFDNITIQRVVKSEEIIQYWSKLVSNGNFENEGTDSYVVRIYNSGGDTAPTIEEGIGVDDSRGIKIVVPAKVSNDWDSQFFIKLKEGLPSGQSFKVSFDIRASEDGISIDSQSHQTPGDYIYWACVGSPSLTTEWQTYSRTVNVSSDMSTDSKTFQTIAFNLAKNDHEVTIYFDNIDVRILKEGTAGDVPEILELQETLDNVADAYAEADDNAANAEIRAAFKEAYEKANNIIDALDQDNAEAAMYALISAQSKLAASIKDYANLQAYIDWVKVKMAAAEAMGERYADLKDALDEIQGSLQDQYAAETWTKAEITDATQKTPVKEQIAAYIAKVVEDGDDVTILMENPDFAGSTTGWSNSGRKSLSYGPTNANNLSNDGGYLPTGMAEVWHGKFDGYQTLSNLPAGLYQITVNAAQRADLDGDDVQTDETAMLYAIVNESETHKLIMSVYDDPAPEMLFDSDAESKWPSIENPNGEGWIPNGKGSGNYHLNAVKEDGSGYYVNTLNVLISEPADMRFGIKDDNAYGWCIMDNFKIVYHTLDNKLALAAAIEGLIDVAEAIDGDGMTNPAEADLYAAVAVGKKVVDNIDATSFEDVNAAFTGLQDAIDDARQNIKINAECETMYWETFAGVLEEYGETAIPAVKAQADAADAKYETVENMTTEEIQAYIDEMKYLCEALLVPGEAAEATDESPVDLTESILVLKGVDVDFEDYADVGANKNYPGWSGSGFGTGGGTAGPVGERWNQTSGFNTYVKLQGLPEGIYSLECDGAYRVGAAGSINDYNLAQATDSVDARIPYLYATTSYGTEKTNLPNVYSVLVTEEIANEKGLDFSSSDNATVTVEIDSVTTAKYLTPQQLATANQFMESGYYLGNKVIFKVGADGNAQLGVRKEKGASNDWTFVDNFKLVYYGANSSQVPTVIEGVQFTAPKAIFTISGVRVNSMNKPGLYIMNGKKVIVK